MTQARRGYTLFELLLGIAVVLGLMLIATPLSYRFFHKNKVAERVNTLVNAVQFAKSQAILLHKTLVLAEIKEDNWGLGMRLFVDHNQNHSFDEDDKLIRVWHFSSKGATVAWHGFVSDHYLLFSNDINKSALNGRFVVSNDKEKREIVISRLGRVHVVAK